MTSSARLTGKAFALGAFALALLFTLACATASQAFADDTAKPYKLVLASDKVNTTTEKDYSFSDLQSEFETKNETTAVTYRYDIAGLDGSDVKTYSVYHTTNLSAPFSKAFAFADSNDQITVEGYWLSTESAKWITINGEKTDDPERVSGSMTCTKEEWMAADARIALRFAAKVSDESTAAKENAEKANLAYLNEYPDTNTRFCPALFVDYTKLSSYKDETRAFVITSIKVKDVKTDGKWNMGYASVAGEIGAATYSGKAQEPSVKLNYCGEPITPRNVGTATNAGTHSITVSDKGFSGSKTVSFTIKKAKISGTPKLSYTSIDYNGTYRQPEVLSGVSGDYNISYSNNLNAGTAKIILTGKGNNYEGTITKTFTINRIAQSFTVDTSVKKESYVSTQAGNHATAKYKVKGAKGKVTFKKIGGSSRLKVNGSTSCRLMIKKGTGHGTYKAKIRVTAAASGNYKATSKTVWLKVKL